jgi:uncharacterized protein YcbK (DUF882 family)
MSSVAFLSLSAAPCAVFAAAKKHHQNRRSLSFHNTHTEECLNIVYWDRGRYLSDALKQIDYILRDHRTNEIRPIDKKLIGLLHTIKRELRTNEPFHIISGYRSPQTNALLRKQSRGVARRSLHLYGEAVDIRLPGCRLSKLRRVAVDLRKGGVGYYPRGDFVHVDVGPIRHW